ncbi:MAG: restriction endonuclease [Caldilineales bacterium]|nr:restriction endonuclease [Caldilineales bacterium]MDW8318048.1 restriction endonuclease [Anaerolineae bacterium]
MFPRPVITATTHVLPFDRLSWEDFERLGMALLLREGFSGLQHYGAAGGERGRDIVAQRNGNLWYVQCKRVKKLSPQALLSELEKLHSLAQADPRLAPQGVLFMVASDVSAQARDRVMARCAELGVACEIWGETDLDVRVKRYPDIVAEFFGPSAGLAAPAPLAADDGALPMDDLTAEEEAVLRRHAFETLREIEEAIAHAQQVLQVRRKQLQALHMARAIGGLDVSALAEATFLEAEIEAQQTQLAELHQADRLIRRLQLPQAMLIKDFLEGNLYGSTVALFAQGMSGPFDALALAQQMAAECPAYRRRVAQRLLADPDADDRQLAEAIRPVIESIVSQPGSGFISVPGGKYRRVHF